MEDILRHAQSSPESEVCGLIAARNGRPQRCIAVANISPRPQTLFQMDPKQQIDAFRDIREAGEELFAIYHSHPHGPPKPSAIDLQQAAYPEALYLIVSSGQEGTAQIRGYRLKCGNAIEVKLNT
ncbi:M67 family metallopeptidase [Thiogranum longum]